jgi:hypothetical protein
LSEEVLALIADSKKFLEPYRMYGKMISDGITQLEGLEKLVHEKAYGDAYKTTCGMIEQLATYRGFVPRLADNLDKMKALLEKLR